MADKKISELTSIVGADTAADDFFVVVDTSGSATKKISRAELNNAIEQDVLAQVDITSANIDGGTIDNTPIGSTTASSGNFTTVDTTGNVTVGGNLTVNGTTTTVNSTTLDVDDINITVASGAASAAAADGAGLTVDGASATFNYASTGDKWTMNKPLDVAGTVTADGLTVQSDVADLAVESTNAAGEAWTLRSTYTNTGGAYGSLQVRDEANNIWLRFNQNNGSDEIDLRTNNTDRLNIANNGDVSLYADDGTTQGFYWDASTQRLGLGLTNPAGALDVEWNANSAGTGMYLQNSNAGSSAFAGVYFGNDVSNTDAFIGLNSSTNTQYGGSRGLLIGTNASSSVAFMTGGAQKAVITSAGNVGIGTASPDGTAHIHTASAGSVTAYTDADDLIVENSGNSGISILSPDTSRSAIMFGHASDNLKMQIRHDGATSLSQIISDDAVTFNVIGGTERMRINDTGVGIGTAAPNRPLQISSSENTLASFTSTDGGAYVEFVDPSASAGQVYIGTNASGFQITTGGSEAARIDSSGSLMAGKTATNIANDGFEAHANNYVGITRNASIPLFLNRRTDDGGLIQFRKDNTEIGSIGSYGGVYANIGTGNVGLMFNTGASAVIPHNMTTNAPRGSGIDLGQSGYKWKDGYFIGTVYADQFLGQNDTNTGIAVGGGDVLQLSTGGSERARLDASGNLLINHTVTGDWTNTSGAQIRASGLGIFTQSASSAIIANRLSTDGTILDLRKDGSAVGSIENRGTTINVITDPSSATGAGVGGTNGAILPCQKTGIADNLIDIGTASFRWDDVYATNGTIQTSDVNEKQDIEALSDAEQRVAVAAKGLLRKYRWKSSVEAKGDDARIHFGIIAQDLQAAFEAEGLDAGRYAMFINSEWTDEETGEQKSRMGIRYNQLLAFIIAAI